MHETNITITAQNSNEITPLKRKESGSSQRSTSIKRMSVVSREIRDMKIFNSEGNDLNSIGVTPIKNYTKRHSDISTFYSS